MYYILPYLNVGASLGELQAHLKPQKAEMIQDINMIFGGPYTFTTKSPAFPSILYVFAAKTKRSNSK